MKFLNKVLAMWFWQCRREWVSPGTKYCLTLGNILIIYMILIYQEQKNMTNPTDADKGFNKFY
jgi:hypothetical protein